MNKGVAGLLGCVLLAAANSIAQAQSIIPPSVPVLTWTGVYGGANIGGTFSSARSSVSTPVGFSNPAVLNAPLFVATATNFANAANASFTSNPSRFIGGVQMGFNYQYSQRILIGAEVDFQGIAGATTRGTTTNVAAVAGGIPVQTSVSAFRAITDVGTLRGRLGVLATPALLFYATGGLAYGSVYSGASIASPAMVQDGQGSNSPSTVSASVQTGYSVGSGVEYRFTNNLSVKGEYLYYDLGKQTVQLPQLVGRGGGFADQPSLTTRFNGNIVRVGLNYRIDLAPPPFLGAFSLGG